MVTRRAALGVLTPTLAGCTAFGGRDDDGDGSPTASGTRGIDDRTEQSCGSSRVEVVRPYGPET